MTLLANAVGVSIGERTILKDVSFNLAPGHWLGLIGPNGAGKTTLLRTLLGQVESSGSMSFGGADLRAMGARNRARLMAFVPQRPLLPPTMTVADYVLLGRTPHTLISAKRVAPIFSPHEKRSTPSSSTNTSPDRCRHCQVVNNSGRSLPERSRRTRPSCCSTSPPPHSTSDTNSRCSEWSMCCAASGG